MRSTVLDQQHAYLDVEVRVQQELKLKSLLALIPHIQHRLQPVCAQRDAIHQTKIMRPLLAELV